MKKISAWVLAMIFAACTTAQDKPADPQATRETVNLYHNLKKLANIGIMFGHQDDLAYGVGWKYVEGKSDVKDVTGDYPAVYGWDVGGLELDHPNNLDGIPFKKMRQYIKEGYARGGVITISWHARSPLGKEKGAWDTTHGTVKAILPGGDHHALYKEWLDKVAAFLLSLKGSKGELIPVLFRPYHELTGNWFWWGRTACSPFEFKTLWRFTIWYLQQEKKVHNLLYVYNTGGDFKTKDEFLERYPDDDMVDMVSFDAYQYEDPQTNNWFVQHTQTMMGILDKVAKEKNKLAAFTETGYEAIPYANWWTETLWKAIGDHKISYVLVWRNHGYATWNKKMHYYAPYKGQTSEADFIRFYQMERTLFEKDVAKQKLYD